MLLSLLKTILFAGVILLLGQIPAGKNTIGGHFQQWVTGLVTKGIHQVDDWRVQAGVSNIPFLSRQVSSKPKPQESVAEPVDLKPVEEEDEVSPSDRESILRLLQ